MKIPAGIVIPVPSAIVVIYSVPHNNTLAPPVARSIPHNTNFGSYLRGTWLFTVAYYNNIADRMLFLTCVFA